MARFILVLLHPANALAILYSYHKLRVFGPGVMIHLLIFTAWSIHQSEYYSCSRYDDPAEDRARLQARDSLKRYVFHYDRVSGFSSFHPFLCFELFANSSRFFCFRSSSSYFPLSAAKLGHLPRMVRFLWIVLACFPLKFLSVWNYCHKISKILNVCE